MTCEAEGVPEVIYSWKKNNLDFELNGKNIMQEPGTGSFTFKELYATDEGEEIQQCTSLKKLKK